jgi:hypothetical protein
VRSEITFDIGDKAIEWLGRASAVAVRKQLPRVALCQRPRAGFATLSGWQPVGNWVALAANFPASVGVIPTTSRESRRTVCVEKWPEAKPSSRMARCQRDDLFAPASKEWFATHEVLD